MVYTRNLAWLTGLAALALLLLALSPLPLADDLEARGAALVTPASAAIQDAVRPVADVVLHAGQVRELTEENARLRQDLARVEAEAVALRDARSAAAQSTALRAAVGGDIAPRHVTAAVLVRDPQPGRRVLVVDRGTNDGVAAGQPVLGPGATLVGVVVEVDARQARVRLLDDPGSAVAAVLQQARTAGALAGREGGLQLEFVPASAQVGVGDLVVSSPLGGRLPAGLLIGRVSEARSQPQELFKTIAVEPLTDYNRIEHVLVLTEFAAPEAKPAP